MTDKQPILAGVDGSRASSAAIRFAAREALRLGAPLRLVHVVAEFVPMAPIAPMHPLLPCDLEDAGRAILARAVEEAHAFQPAVEVSSSLVDGPRVHTLVQMARGARMVVLGHERHPSIDRLLTGATVTAVAAASACPVVAVPPDWTATFEHGCVLVGVKSTTDSPQLLRRAFEAAADRQARLVILHAWELPTEYDELITARVDEIGWQDRARHAIERAIATFQDAYPEVKVDVRVVHGQAAHALRRASESADVLLLARRTRAFPIGHLGGTATALLRHSSCPVAVVPPANEPEPRLDLVLEHDGALEK
jgi:nucleotide-binding universal stress UspA family protein